jgi:hypothetical protein
LYNKTAGCGTSGGVSYRNLTVKKKKELTGRSSLKGDKGPQWTVVSSMEKKT